MPKTSTQKIEAVLAGVNATLATCGLHDPIAPGASLTVTTENGLAYVEHGREVMRDWFRGSVFIEDYLVGNEDGDDFDLDGVRLAADLLALCVAATRDEDAEPVTRI
jgi:hypothetical protein